MADNPYRPFLPPDIETLDIAILVAEDDFMMGRVTRDMLAVLGMPNVDVVRSGQEAIQALYRKEYDILICDWVMHPMSGLELTRYLRTELASPNRLIPIIMLTGKSERKDIEAARDAGITEYLVKPFTAAALAERIKTVIEDPRPFIIVKNYKGPDRRRKRNAPPDGTERRRRRNI